MTRFGIDPTTFLQLARGADRPLNEHQLVAPNPLRTRALELLLAEVEAGRLDDRAALDIHERMTELKVRLLGDRASRRVAWQLAREHGWPDLADSEVLAVTKLQADALVTVDPALAERASGVVEVAPFGALFDPT